MLTQGLKLNQCENVKSKQEENCVAQRLFEKET